MLSSSAICGGKLKVALVSGEYLVVKVREWIFSIVIILYTREALCRNVEAGITDSFKY
jgi:hypothetical protein